MADCKITFLPHNKEDRVPAGETLIRAAMEAGVHINASCGGEGVCGKCRVLIESGDVSGPISKRLRDDDIKKGYRLACQTMVSGDITVRVPIESEVDATVLKRVSTPRRTARIHTVNFDELKDDLGEF